MRLCRLTLVAIGLFIAGPLQAAAQQPSLQLELFWTKPENNKCNVIFRASNKLGVNLDKVAFEVYIISTTDSFEGTNTFVFPSIPADRMKYAQFLLDIQCNKIGRLDMNGFTECRGDKDYLQLCKEKAQLSTKVPISFSDQPQG